ncbi:MAG: phospholipase D family protein, partial [Thermodesulfobium sp.]
LGIFVSQYLPSPITRDALILPKQNWVIPSTEHAPIKACFTPESLCTEGIIQTIQEAKTSIYVQAYSFTSLPIAQALVEAKKRGVDVNVILDKRQITARGSKLPLLIQNNVPVLIDTVHGIAHNKVMIIDGSHTITGSFNFTDAADSRNAENVLIINDPELSRIYKDNWDKRAKTAKYYTEAS